MILGIYTDMHCSYTSSIMPLYSEDSRYTTRLDMIVKSGKWMYDLFDNYNVDLIANLGDTFDKNIVKSEELTAISEFYSCSHGRKEITLVGNHEMVNDKFNAISILDNYSFIKVYDIPMKINDTFSVIPYMKTEDITYDLLSSINNKVLLSHIDIKGSSIRTGYDLEFGIDPEYLAMNFETTLNGHIHKHSVVSTSENKVINVGSMTSISFSDSNSYIPGVMIYDTQTRKFKLFENPYAILFRKYYVKDMNHLIEIIKNNISKKHKYIIGLEVPYEIKDEAKSYIESIENIIASRVTVYIKEGSKIITEDNSSKISLYSDIDKEFLSFIKDNQNLLKYPYNQYENIIGSLQGES